MRGRRHWTDFGVQLTTHRTQRFIRWVRVWIYKQAPWRDSIARLREVWATTSA